MPTTPTLVIDVDVLNRNIARMAQRAEALGVALRPHVKTHKMPQIAALQREAGGQGITVATIAEAEVFARCGHEDIFIAYPLWLDAGRGRQLAQLAEHVRVRIGCDSLESAAQTRSVVGVAPIEVLLEVDSGQHRSGIAPEEAGKLAAGVTELGLNVTGLFTFPGHSYGTDTGTREAAAQAEADALRIGAGSMAAQGITPNVRSGGSSPSMAYANAAGDSSEGYGANEMRPGAYVFNDAQQWELGACTAEDIALTAHSTVVSRSIARRQIVLDAGSKTLSPDRPAWASGAGRLLDYPQARMTQLSEHHAVVEMPSGPLPELGATVRAVPNHCCNAVNLADEVTVVQAGRVLETWPVAARGFNS